MLCPYCSTEISEEDEYCSNCGQPIPSYTKKDGTNNREAFLDAEDNETTCPSEVNDSQSVILPKVETEKDNSSFFLIEWLRTNSKMIIFFVAGLLFILLGSSIMLSMFNKTSEIAKINTRDSCSYNGHVWDNSSCTEVKTCTICGFIDNVVVHKWTEPTCTEGSKCEICGLCDGEPLGHLWNDATYVKPKTCTRCGSIEGNPLATVGATITFGHYEQDNSTTNGTEPIEWIVLEMNDEKMLVVSRYALDCVRYNYEDEDVTWETCSIRQWLNNSFYNAAFSSEEQSQIFEGDVTAEPNYIYNTYPGNDTRDKVFLLSLSQAENLFSSDTERFCSPTPYAVSRGAYVNSSTGGSWWWLRTTGITNSDATSVNSDGSIDYDDGSVNSSRGAVRPAVWISCS